MIEPGFFSNPAVQVALVVGGVVAVACGIVGTFTVMRGQSFAGHSLADIGTAGGSAAFLLGVNPLYGFVAMNVAGAGAMELIGIGRARGRDVATGIVLGAALGLAALFLYLDTTSTSQTGAAVSVLFGSVFTLSFSVLPFVVVLAAVSVGLVAVFYRPLLLSSVSPDLAAARGVSPRAVGIAFLTALALAASLSAITIGAILSTALLIGPAATAVRLSRRAGVAAGLAALLALAATWLGIILSYDSFYWGVGHEGWPVSFFVVAAVVAFHLLAQLVPGGSRRRGSDAGLRGRGGATGRGASRAEVA